MIDETLEESSQTYRDLFEKLQKFTHNFTLKMGRCPLEDRKDLDCAIGILKRYYKNVDKLGLDMEREGEDGKVDYKIKFSNPIPLDELQNVEHVDSIEEPLHEHFKLHLDEGKIETDVKDEAEDINEMAYEKSYVIDKCAELGKQFIEHFDKIYNDIDEGTIKHHGEEMQSWLDQASSYRMKYNNKTPNEKQLYDWFITVGKLPVDLFDNETEAEVYDDFANNLLDTDKNVLAELRRQDLLHDSLNEDVSDKDDYKAYVNDIIDFFETKGLNLEPRPEIEFDDLEQDGLNIETGKYLPKENKIIVYTNGRHPKDILRTLCHELVHHNQHLENKDLHNDGTNISDDNNLKDVEAEAYKLGNLYFREWTEQLNNLDEHKSLEEAEKHYHLYEGLDFDEKITINVNLPLKHNEDLPSGHKEDFENYDEETLNQWHEFTYDVVDLVSSIGDIRSEVESPNSLSYYIDFYIIDNEGNKKSCLLDMRVSDHSQTRNGKLKRRKEANKIDTDNRFITITVNNRTYNSYDEALNRVDFILNSLKNDYNDEILEEGTDDQVIVVFRKYRDEFDTLNDVRDVQDYLNNLYSKGGMEAVDKWFSPYADDEYKNDFKKLINSDFDEKSLQNEDYLDIIKIIGQYSINENIKFLARSVAKDFKRAGEIDFRGAEVKTPRDLAELFAIYRDPRFETQRVVFVKGDKIVAVRGVSSRMPNGSSFIRRSSKSRNLKDEMIKMFIDYRHLMERTEANGYYLFHNHPSGSVEFSDGDYKVDDIFKSNLKGYLGSIVIGDDKANILSNDSEQIIDIDGDNLKSIHSILGVQYNGNAKNIARQYKDYNTVVVFLNSQNEVSAIAQIDEKDFNNKEIYNRLDNEGVSNGADRIVVITTNSDLFTKLVPHVNSGELIDIMYYDEDKNEAQTSYSNTSLVNNAKRLADKVDNRRYNEQIYHISDAGHSYCNIDEAYVTNYKVIMDGKYMNQFDNYPDASEFARRLRNRYKNSDIEVVDCSDFEYDETLEEDKKLKEIEAPFPPTGALASPCVMCENQDKVHSSRSIPLLEDLDNSIKVTFDLDGALIDLSNDVNEDKVPSNLTFDNYDDLLNNSDEYDVTTKIKKGNNKSGLYRITDPTSTTYEISKGNIYANEEIAQRIVDNIKDYASLGYLDIVPYGKNFEFISNYESTDDPSDPNKKVWVCKSRNQTFQIYDKDLDRFKEPNKSWYDANLGHAADSDFNKIKYEISTYLRTSEFKILSDILDKLNADQFSHFNKVYDDVRNKDDVGDLLAVFTTTSQYVLDPTTHQPLPLYFKVDLTKSSKGAEVVDSKDLLKYLRLTSLHISAVGYGHARKVKALQTSKDMFKDRFNWYANRALTIDLNVTLSKRNSFADDVVDEAEKAKLKNQLSVCEDLIESALSSNENFDMTRYRFDASNVSYELGSQSVILIKCGYAGKDSDEVSNLHFDSFGTQKQLETYFKRLLDKAGNSKDDRSNNYMFSLDSINVNLDDVPIDKKIRDRIAQIRRK